MAYNSLADIERQKALSQQLLSQRMGGGRKPRANTDAFSGLAHMLRQWQGGKASNRAVEMASENQDIEANDMARLLATAQGDLSGQGLGPLRENQTYDSPRGQNLALSQALQEANADKAHGRNLEIQGLKNANKREPIPTVNNISYLDEDGNQRVRQELVGPGGSTRPYPTSPTGGANSDLMSSILMQQPGASVSPSSSSPAPTPTPSSAKNTDGYKDVKRAGEIKAQDKAKQNLTTTVTGMFNNFLALEGEGANVNYKQSPIKNIGEFIRAEIPIFDKAMGTKVSRLRQEIGNARPTLLNFLRQATEQGARGLDSNRELDFYLLAATRDSGDIHANMAALYRLQQLLGTGGKIDINPQWQEQFDKLNDEYNTQSDSQANLIQQAADDTGMSVEDIRAEMAERRTRRIDEELSSYGE
jgi:hypothetical protein